MTASTNRSIVDARTTTPPFALAGKPLLPPPPPPLVLLLLFPSEDDATPKRVRSAARALSLLSLRSRLACARSHAYRAHKKSTKLAGSAIKTKKNMIETLPPPPRPASPPPAAAASVLPSFVVVGEAVLFFVDDKDEENNGDVLPGG